MRLDAQTTPWWVAPCRAGRTPVRQGKDAPQQGWMLPSATRLVAETIVSAHSPVEAFHYLLARLEPN
jgi:hypothetical protein